MVMPTTNAIDEQPYIDTRKAQLELFLDTSTHISAQLSRDFCVQFGEGGIDLAKYSMYVLAKISLYVDMDFKVTKPLKYIYKETGLRLDVFDRCVSELFTKEYLVKSTDGFYVTTKSHVLVKPNNPNERKSETYIPHYHFLSDIKSYTGSLNTVRMMYFILSQTTMFPTYTGKLTRLYKNKLAKDNGNCRLLYNRDVKSVLTEIMTLWKNDVLHFRLKDKDGQEFNTNRFKNISRESKESIDMSTAANQVLKSVGLTGERFEAQEINSLQSIITINRYTERYVNTASIAEIDMVFRNYNLDYTEVFANTEGLFDVSNNDANIIISMKNQLCAIVGNAGIEIYRQALHAFVEENCNDLRKLVQTNEFVSTFKDFYLNKLLHKMFTTHFAAVASNESLTKLDIVQIAIGNTFTCINRKALDDLLLHFANLTNINRLIMFMDDLVTYIEGVQLSTERILFNLTEMYPALRSVRQQYKAKVLDLYERIVVKEDANISFELFQTLLPQIVTSAGTSNEVFVRTFIKKLHKDAEQLINTKRVQENVKTYQQNLTESISDYMLQLLTRAGAAGVFVHYTQEKIDPIIEDFFNELMDISVNEKVIPITSQQRTAQINSLKEITTKRMEELIQNAKTHL